MKRTHRLAPGLLLLLSLPVAVAAGGGDADLDRLVRDQRTVKARLEKLLDKMERLEKKLREQGKTYNAELLNRALKEVRSKQVAAKVDELLPDLAGGRFTTVQRQEELVKELEAVYSILLDRNDLERLEQRLERVRAGLRSLRELRGEQRRLVEDTRKLTEDRRALTEKALREVEAALERQREVAAKTAELQNRPDASLPSLLRRLDDLAARQGELTRRSAERLAEAAGRVRERLDAAFRNEREAKDLLEQLPDEGEGGDAQRERARSLQEDVLAALDGLDRDAAGNLTPAVRRAVARARDAARSAGNLLRDGKDIGTAKQAVENALRALEEARHALSDELRQKVERPPREEVQRQGDVAEEAAELGAELSGRSGDSRAAGQAAESLAAAARKAAEARDAMADGDVERAGDAQREASERLEEARRRLAEGAGAVARAQQELAAKQEYARGLAETARRTAEEIARRFGDQDPDAAARLEAEREAVGAMQGSEESLRDGDAGKAEQEQERAIGRLGEALESLKKAAAQLSRKGSDAGLQSGRFAELKARQEEIEKRTRDLAQRLKELEDARQQESMEKAQESMRRAQSELESERGEEAVAREEEAEKHLQEAEDRLENEEERYQNLRQEELLFKVKDELVQLRDAVAKVRDRTVEIDLARKERRGERLRRSERARVREMGGECRRLSERNDQVRERIAKDGATVFTFTLRKNGEDLRRLAEALSTPPYATDPFTQSIEEDVVDRYDQLLATLDEELERRRKAKPQQGEPGQKGQNRKQPLIPKVAELLMVKRMEERAMRRIDAFLRLRSEDEPFSEVDRERLARLGHEHRSITDLFDALVGTDQEPTEEASEGDSEGKPEKKNDEGKEDGR